MTRTKAAIAGLFFIQADPFGPSWLELLISIAQFATAAFLLWYLISDTEPRETYTKRVATRRVRMEKP